ncbi:MAG TPA: tetratricopeptide repeat protein [Candidatus Cloacimonadota bacterium]|nr:tetratricopeptide repeat protein [Candidatus Cloacimonadota bacterium]
MRPAVIFLLLAMLFGATFLFSQYNERDILAQEAYQLLARRQYSEAEALFLRILEKYPEDLNSVLQLNNIYLQTSQLDKAENLLNSKQRILPSSILSEQRILLLVYQGKPTEAMQLANSYLASINHDQNKYRQLASYFEQRGFYEQVLKLYTDARKNLKNNDIFLLEVANTALNFRQLEQSTTEYLRFLELNPSNIFFINNQIKLILQEDPGLIRLIEGKARAVNNPQLWELYANARVFLKDYKSALDAFANLPLNQLYRFAEEQYAAMNDNVALMAFERLQQSAPDLFRKADYQLRMAQIQARNAHFDQAKTILDSLFAIPELSVTQNRNRTQANFLGRKLLAEVELNLGLDPDAVITTLEEARRFSRNPGENQEISLSIARLQLMRENYAAVGPQLAAINDPRLLEISAYYRFLLKLMQGHTQYADSLMNEYVISYPASAYVNDAIYLMMMVLGMQAQDQTAFFAAFRRYNLADRAAPSMLLVVYEKVKDEELKLMAVEWAIALGEFSLAQTILEQPWEDSVAREYSAVLSLSLVSDPEYQQRQAREFLKNQPESIFSPRLRQVISRMGLGRPNL